MLEAQQHLPRATGKVRVGSWNIRTFPDGDKTDVPWLACAIALMDVPLLAVQEIKSNPPARKAALRLISLLNRHTGGDWKLDLEQCGDGNVPHVGILFDAARVTTKNVRAAYALRPTDERPCGVDLHPGLRASVAFRGGPRFEFVSVHLPSGPGKDHATLRRHSWRGSTCSATRRWLRVTSTRRVAMDATAPSRQSKKSSTSPAPFSTLTYSGCPRR